MEHRHSAGTEAETESKRSYTIEYVERLRFGEIPGAGRVHVDLKEVLHMLIIGEGDKISLQIMRNPKTLMAVVMTCHNGPKTLRRYFALVSLHAK